MGGKAHPPMSLDTFTFLAMKGLDEVSAGKPSSEVPVGSFPQILSETWRSAFNGALNMIGVEG